MARKLLFPMLLFVPAAFAQIGGISGGTLSCALSVPVIPALSPTSSSALVGNVFADCTSPTAAPSVGTPLPQDNLAFVFESVRTEHHSTGFGYRCAGHALES
jgi:hypothetical protein